MCEPGYNFAHHEIKIVKNSNADGFIYSTQVIYLMDYSCVNVSLYYLIMTTLSYNLQSIKYVIS